MESRSSSLRELAARRLALALLPLCLAVAGCAPAGPAPTVQAGDPDRAEVVIGGVSFEAELAVEPDERAQGLSGRASLPPKTGMLFVFEEPRVSSFWMKEMRFPLDFVWIGEECAVVDITADVPAPAPGAELSDLPSYSPGEPAAYNFEINAGEAEEYGLAVGDPVRIYGMPGGVEDACGPSAR